MNPFLSCLPQPASLPLLYLPLPTSPACHSLPLLPATPYLSCPPLPTSPACHSLPLLPANPYLSCPPLPTSPARHSLPLLQYVEDNRTWCISQSALRGRGLYAMESNPLCAMYRITPARYTRVPPWPATLVLSDGHHSNMSTTWDGFDGHAANLSRSPFNMIS